MTVLIFQPSINSLLFLYYLFVSFPILQTKKAPQRVYICGIMHKERGWHVCVCVRERERERKIRGKNQVLESSFLWLLFLSRISGYRMVLSLSLFSPRRKDPGFPCMRSKSSILQLCWMESTIRSCKRSSLRIIMGLRTPLLSNAICA